MCLPSFFGLKKKSNRNLRQNPLPKHHFSVKFTWSQFFLDTFKSFAVSICSCSVSYEILCFEEAVFND